jgi:hypothetical protein
MKGRLQMILEAGQTPIHQWYSREMEEVVLQLNTEGLVKAATRRKHIGR